MSVLLARVTHIKLVARVERESSVRRGCGRRPHERQPSPEMATALPALVELSQSVVSALLDAFRTGDGVDLIRESVRLVMQELIETEATEQIGARPLRAHDPRPKPRLPAHRGSQRTHHPRNTH